MSDDLSHLAADSLAVTSQAGGNMTADSTEADTAPGSAPVDPVIPAGDQGDPKITASPAPPHPFRHLAPAEPGGGDSSASWTQATTEGWSAHP